MSKTYERPPGYTEDEWNAKTAEEQEQIVGTLSPVTLQPETEPVQPTGQTPEQVEEQREKAKKDPGQPESYPTVSPVAPDLSQTGVGRSTHEIANAAARGQVFPEVDDEGNVKERKAGDPPVATAGP